MASGLVLIDSPKCKQPRLWQGVLLFGSSPTGGTSSRLTAPAAPHSYLHCSRARITFRCRAAAGQSPSVVFIKFCKRKLPSGHWAQESSRTLPGDGHSCQTLAAVLPQLPQGHCRMEQLPSGCPAMATACQHPRAPPTSWGHGSRSSHAAEGDLPASWHGPKLPCKTALALGTHLQDQQQLVLQDRMEAAQVPHSLDGTADLKDALRHGKIGLQVLGPKREENPWNWRKGHGLREGHEPTGEI